MIRTSKSSDVRGYNSAIDTPRNDLGNLVNLAGIDSNINLLFSINGVNRRPD